MRHPRAPPSGDEFCSTCTVSAVATGAAGTEMCLGMDERSAGASCHTVAGALGLGIGESLSFSLSHLFPSDS